MGLLENIRSFSVIALGAIIGSSIRFLIYTELERLRFKKYYVILSINTLATFFLGLFYSLSLHINYWSNSVQLGLFIFIGVLGSFSTFSTFIYDLYELSSQKKYLRAFNLFIFSLFLGMISLAFGLLLGKP